MGRRKTVVYLMTVLLLGVLGLTELLMMQREDFPFSVTVQSDGGSEKIAYWRKEDTFYVFLPSYARPEQAKLVTSPLAGVTIDGRPVGKGTVLADFPQGEPLTMTYRNRGKTSEKTVIFTQSAHVAAMYIDTVSGSMDYIHETKGNAESGKLRLYTPEGALDCAAQVRAMNGRGNSSWDADKKPYSLELVSEENLLGMGAAKKWILLANAYESSNICNKMVFDFAAEVGNACSPQCQWTELYLNGQYAGLYLLCERNELHPQRVDVDERESFLISLSVDWQLDESRPCFSSRQGNLMRIHQTGLSQDQVRDLWQCAENAIYASDGIDPVTGKHWLELIDLDSWAHQYLLDEVFVEFDAFALSQFFYYEPESGKIFGGPIWDSDNILNRSWNQPANILACDRPHIWSDDDAPLSYALSRKEEFRQRVKQLYYQVYRPKLLELADGGMERYLAQSLPAAEQNRIRWEGAESWSEVERLRAYLKERISFLDAYWAAEEDFCTVDVKADLQWRRFAVRKGDTAEFLQVCSQEYGEVLWVDYHSAEQFHMDEPVTQNHTLLMLLPDTETGDGYD